MKKTATFSSRLMAYNLDLTILLVVFVPMVLWIEHNYILYPTMFAVVCFYHAFFECSGWQATPGKRQGKLMVISVDGGKLLFFQALVRILLKFLSLGLLFAGFFMIYFRKDRKGLHDLLAGTQVVLRRD